MKFTPIFLLLLTLAACNNSRENDPDANGTTRDSILSIDTSGKQDFHTTYTDVIENLFLFINKKEWRTAAGFYADTMASGFFRQYMKDESIQRLELTGISKSGDEVLVRTNAIDAKGTGREVCFLFNINEHNKVISQRKSDCP